MCLGGETHDGISVFIGKGRGNISCVSVDTEGRGWMSLK